MMYFIWNDLATTIGRTVYIIIILLLLDITPKAIDIYLTSIGA